MFVGCVYSSVLGVIRGRTCSTAAYRCDVRSKSSDLSKAVRVLSYVGISQVDPINFAFQLIPESRYVSKRLIIAVGEI